MAQPPIQEYDDPNLLRPDHEKPTHANPRPLNITCPHCGRAGSFSPIGGINDAQYLKWVGSVENNRRQSTVTMTMGLRRCPNPNCGALIAFADGGLGRPQDNLPWVAPPELIDFQTNGVPEKIVKALREAIASHSVASFNAAALMVRKTLELLCEDKGVKGGNLKERISNLGEHAVLPPKLLAAADHLRILGNDAAHVEAKVYEDVDKPHAEVAIDVAKEILKAVYQHDDLIERLMKLAKSVTS